MHELMERRPVIRLGIFERIFRRQVNAITLPVVERPIILIVVDCGFTIAENSFTSFDGFEGPWFLRYVGRNSVDLPRIEHCINSMNKALYRLLLRFGILTIACCGCSVPCLSLDLPKLDLST